MAADLIKQRAATCLQASVRGFLLREQLKNVQEDFESVVAELEGSDMHVLWPSNKNLLGFPILTRDPSEKLSTRHFVKQCHNGIDNETILECTNEVDKTITTKEIVDYNSSLPSSINRREYSQKDGSESLDKLQLIQKDSEVVNCSNENAKAKQSTAEDAELIEKRTDECKFDENKNKRIEDNKENILSDPVLSCEIPFVNIGESGTSTPLKSFSPGFEQHSTPALSEGSEQPATKRGFRTHPVLTDSWMTDKSFDPAADDYTSELPDDKSELQKVREQIAMELLWTQQAIESRKNYLRLKKTMENDTQVTEQEKKSQNSE